MKGRIQLGQHLGMALPSLRANVRSSRSSRSCRARCGAGVGSCGGCSSSPISSASSPRSCSLSLLVSPNPAVDFVGMRLGDRPLRREPAALGAPCTHARPLRPGRGANRPFDDRRHLRHPPGGFDRHLGIRRSHRDHRPPAPEPHAPRGLLGHRHRAGSPPPRDRARARKAKPRVHPERHRRRVRPGGAPARQQDRQPPRVRAQDRRLRRSRRTALPRTATDLSSCSGRPRTCPSSCTQHAVHRVAIAFSTDSHEQTLAVIRSMQDSDVQIDIVPRMFEVLGTNAQLHTIEGIPLVGLPIPRLTARSGSSSARSTCWVRPPASCSSRRSSWLSRWR